MNSKVASSWPLNEFCLKPPSYVFQQLVAGSGSLRVGLAASTAVAQGAGQQQLTGTSRVCKDAVLGETPVLAAGDAAPSPSGYKRSSRIPGPPAHADAHRSVPYKHSKLPRCPDTLSAVETAVASEPAGAAVARPNTRDFDPSCRPMSTAFTGLHSHRCCSDTTVDDSSEGNFSVASSLASYHCTAHTDVHPSGFCTGCEHHIATIPTASRHKRNAPCQDTLGTRVDRAQPPRHAAVAQQHPSRSPRPAANWPEPAHTAAQGDAIGWQASQPAKSGASHAVTATARPTISSRQLPHAAWPTPHHNRLPSCKAHESPSKHHTTTYHGPAAPASIQASRSSGVYKPAPPTPSYMRSTAAFRGKQHTVSLFAGGFCGPTVSPRYQRQASTASSRLSMRL